MKYGHYKTQQSLCNKLEVSVHNKCVDAYNSHPSPIFRSHLLVLLNNFPLIRILSNIRRELNVYTRLAVYTFISGKTFCFVKHFNQKDRFHFYFFWIELFYVSPIVVKIHWQLFELLCIQTLYRIHSSRHTQNITAMTKFAEAINYY